jgi:hypothetical protein
MITTNKSSSIKVKPLSFLFISNLPQ